MDRVLDACCRRRRPGALLPSSVRDRQALGTGIGAVGLAGAARAFFLGLVRLDQADRDGDARVRRCPAGRRARPPARLVRPAVRVARRSRWVMCSRLRIAAAMSPARPAAPHALLVRAAADRRHARRGADRRVIPAGSSQAERIELLGSEARVKGSDRRRSAPAVASRGSSARCVSASATAANCERTPSFCRIDRICERTVVSATKWALAISSALRPCVSAASTSASRCVSWENVACARSAVARSTRSSSSFSARSVRPRIGRPATAALLERRVDLVEVLDTRIQPGGVRFEFSCEDGPSTLGGQQRRTRAERYGGTDQVDAVAIAISEC